MKKLYKWLLIGGLSLLGLIITMIIMPYSHKLTVSIALLCGLTLLVSTIVLIINRRLFDKSLRKWDAHATKAAIFPGIAFVTLTLALALLLDFVMVFVNFIIPPPFYVHLEGIEHYQSNAYQNERWGKEASEYLPPYDTLEDATSIEFVYDDGLFMETLFFHTDTKFVLDVYYDSTLYAAKKQEAIKGGENFGDTLRPDIWLLGKEKLPFGNCLYYLVICSDDECKLEYLVTIQDSDDCTAFHDLSLSWGS